MALVFGNHRNEGREKAVGPFALGFNYWFNTQFVIKTSVHWVEGNRYALPEGGYPEAADLTDWGSQLDDDTRLFMLGAQFSF